MLNVTSITRAIMVAGILAATTTSIAGHATPLENNTLNNPTWMTMGKPTPPPMGYVRYCLENRSDCTTPTQEIRTSVPAQPLTDHTWQQLSIVNKRVNKAITAMDDLDNTGHTDYWGYTRNGYGDCEDYALEKMKILHKAGWLMRDLLLTTAYTEDGEAHVVLTVATASGDFILDNRFDTPKRWDAMPYTWLARQQAGRPLTWLKAIQPDDMRAPELLAQRQPFPRTYAQSAGIR